MKIVAGEAEKSEILGGPGEGGPGSGLKLGWSGWGRGGPGRGGPRRLDGAENAKFGAQQVHRPVGLAKLGLGQSSCGQTWVWPNLVLA